MRRSIVQFAKRRHDRRAGWPRDRAQGSQRGRPHRRVRIGKQPFQPVAHPSGCEDRFLRIWENRRGVGKIAQHHRGRRANFRRWIGHRRHQRFNGTGQATFAQITDELHPAEYRLFPLQLLRQQRNGARTGGVAVFQRGDIQTIGPKIELAIAARQQAGRRAGVAQGGSNRQKDRGAANGSVKPIYSHSSDFLLSYPRFSNTRSLALATSSMTTHAAPTIARCKIRRS